MLKKAKVIAVNNPANSIWIGRIVEVLNVVKHNTLYYSRYKEKDGVRCIYEEEIAFFNPEHLEEV